MIKLAKTYSLLAVLGFVGCTQSDFGHASGGVADGDDGDGPGSADDGRPGDDARDPDDDVTCEADDECGHGETCQDGVCQMPRCADGPYVSGAPLGPGLRFAIDREIVVADSVPFEGSYYVDGYAPTSGSIDYPGSWEIGASPIVDVASGRFLDDAEQIAVATEGSTIVTLHGRDEIPEIDVGFQPFALGSGDVDRDRHDELVVLGQFGNVALCEVREGTCTEFVIQNGTSRDLAVADVDGDGYDEPVLLLNNGDVPTIYVWNTDAVNQQEDYSAAAGHEITRIDAGDLDGDGTAELVAFEDDGWFSSAQLYVYQAAGGAIAERSVREIDVTSRDVTVADIDRDGRSEVFVLREMATIELLRAAGDTMSLMPELTHQLQVSSDPLRIAMSDFDADSPRARLVSEEPELLAGPIVPSMVIHFPPYDGMHSTDASGVTVGVRETTSESLTDTVSLGLNVDVGVSANLFEIFKVGMSTQVSQEVTFTQGMTTSLSIGDRHKAEADPSLFGFDYGLVVVSCGCFHAYYYEVEDPGEHMGAGGNGERFVMLLPVGGTTTMWSSPRYNAMAEAVGNLPIVEIDYKLGDPTSYPRGPQRPGGLPILEEDMVFPELPSYLVSDVGSIGWQLSVGETEVNGSAVKTGIKVSGSLGVGPFQFGAGLGASWGQAYQLSVGDEAQFGGSVPPIPDNPETPEDEYLENAFSFAPYVYREHYTDAEGEEAAYYVMSYAVGE